MAASDALIFYDLTPNHEEGQPQPVFSPATVRGRLALLAKGVPFTTKWLTYGELRREWCGLDKPLGVEEATAPFIQRPDGSYLVDSVEIAKWLDETYPDRTNLFLPEASLPVDLQSTEYVMAVESISKFEKTFRWNPFIFLYCPFIIQLMSKEDHDYFISDERWGPGVWQKNVVNKSTDEWIKEGKDWVRRVEAAYPNLRQGFLSSRTKPGFLDFHVAGLHQMLSSVDGATAKEIFVGDIAVWLDRVDSLYSDGPEGLTAMKARDLKKHSGVPVEQQQKL